MLCSTQKDNSPRSVLLESTLGVFTLFVFGQSHLFMHKSCFCLTGPLGRSLGPYLRPCWSQSSVLQIVIMLIYMRLLIVSSNLWFTCLCPFYLNTSIHRTGMLPPTSVGLCFSNPIKARVLVIVPVETGLLALTRL